MAPAGTVRIHPWLLTLQPEEHERAYWDTVS